MEKKETFEPFLGLIVAFSGRFLGLRTQKIINNMYISPFLDPESLNFVEIGPISENFNSKILFLGKTSIGGLKL